MMTVAVAVAVGGHTNVGCCAVGVLEGVTLGTNIEPPGFVPLKYSSTFVYPSASLSADPSEIRR